MVGGRPSTRTPRWETRPETRSPAELTPVRPSNVAQGSRVCLSPRGNAWVWRRAAPTCRTGSVVDLDASSRSAESTEVGGWETRAFQLRDRGRRSQPCSHGARPPGPQSPAAPCSQGTQHVFIPVPSVDIRLSGWDTRFPAGFCDPVGQEGAEPRAGDGKLSVERPPRPDVLTGLTLPAPPGHMSRE